MIRRRVHAEYRPQYAVPLVQGALARAGNRALQATVRRIAGLMPSPAVAAGGAVAAGAFSKYMGYGKKSSSAPIVTRQSDVNIPARARSKKTKFARRIQRRRKVRQRKFKRKIKRAIKAPSYKLTNVWNIGRSYKSDLNASHVTFIPLCGYRGPASTTVSTGVGASGATTSFFRSDIVKAIIDKWKNDLFRPSSTTTNAIDDKNWWIAFKRATIDVSITNTGGAEGGGITDNAVEYDIYHMWPKHKYIGDIDMQQFANYDVQAQNQETNFGAEATTNYNVNNTGYEPWQRPFQKRWYGIKKLANGYIALGETIRFNKSLKLKRLITQRFWENEEITDAQKNSLSRGLGGALVISFRGAPKASTPIGGYPRARLTFNVNHAVYCSLPSQVQTGGSSNLLFADSFI